MVTEVQKQELAFVAGYVSAIHDKRDEYKWTFDEEAALQRVWKILSDKANADG